MCKPKQQGQAARPLCALASNCSSVPAAKSSGRQRAAAATPNPGGSHRVSIAQLEKLGAPAAGAGVPLKKEKKRRGSNVSFVGRAEATLHAGTRMAEWLRRWT
ncbi:hypothetical protein HispidOSU_031101 [Sigmodon hispidus]